MRRYYCGDRSAKRIFYCGGVEFLRDVLGLRCFLAFPGRCSQSVLCVTGYRAQEQGFTQPGRPSWAPHNLRFFRPFKAIFGYFFSIRWQALLCAVEGLGSPYLNYEFFCPGLTPTLPFFQSIIVGTSSVHRRHQ
jgi:hypothetical protein